MNTSTFPSPEGSIDCTVRGPLLLIAINRPAKRNGFTPKMFRELGEAYTRLDDDPALRVGVLHALGDHFTAGQALDEALRIAEAIAAQAPLAVVATRKNALKAVEHGPVLAMQDFIAVQQGLSRSEDAAEGVRSFVEKRPARFVGR